MQEVWQELKRVTAKKRPDEALRCSILSAFARKVWFPNGLF
jgi:hypothetical protein